LEILGQNHDLVEGENIFPPLSELMFCENCCQESLCFPVFARYETRKQQPEQTQTGVATTASTATATATAIVRLHRLAHWNIPGEVGRVTLNCALVVDRALVNDFAFVGYLACTDIIDCAFVGYLACRRNSDCAIVIECITPALKER
jgi:hypothetical protein